MFMAHTPTTMNSWWDSLMFVICILLKCTKLFNACTSNPLKTEMNLNYSQIFSSYRAVNILLL